MNDFVISPMDNFPTIPTAIPVAKKTAANSSINHLYFNTPKIKTAIPAIKVIRTSLCLVSIPLWFLTLSKSNDSLF